MKGKRRKKITKKQLRSAYKIVGTIDLDEKQTKASLIKYIRTSTKLINEAYPTMNRASALDVKKAIRIIGKGRGKDTLGTRLTNKSKKELLEQSRLLQTILHGDTTSRVASAFEDIRMERAYKSFIKSPLGFKLNRDEYKELGEVSSSLIEREKLERRKLRQEAKEGLEAGTITLDEYKDLLQQANDIKDIFETYGSAEVYKLMEEYKNDLSITTIGDIVKEEYYKAHSVNTKTLTKAIVDRIKEEIS